MATIHISRTEAANGFDDMISRASQGDEFVIEENASPVAVLRPVKPQHIRLLSESLRLAQEHGSTVTLDDEFGRDLTDIINSRREPMFDPKNDPWA
jgi:antitoxin (DNA-binding transcriptional repressor) of toxin-antitoxin stability system